MTEVDKNIVDKIIAEKGVSADKVIPVLQEIQASFNYLPEEALERVCEISDITPASIFSVSTFYSQFNHEKIGKHVIRVCVGTACHVKGAMLVYDGFRRELKIKDGKITDSEGLFTVLKVACLGCCTIAPVIQIDDVTYGNVSTDKVSSILENFLLRKKEPEKKEENFSEVKEDVDGEIRIGLGSCCVASGSAEVRSALERTLKEYKINVNVKHVGCVGICNQVPMIEIVKNGIEPEIFTHVVPSEVTRIVLDNFRSHNFMARSKASLLDFIGSLSEEEVPVLSERYGAGMVDTPVSEFLSKQINIATENRGLLKPLDIDEYIKLGGFVSLRYCLNVTDPLKIIEIIKNSGLRGRGGAGFPTWKKWDLVRNSENGTKYLICNGDEGDPGAFMDRMLLESYPFRVIEGMLIAALATGATKGFFYIRAEYKLAVKQISSALKICRDKNILGKNILESSFSFDIDLFEGAGAFVCGEETALIASIEGKRGFSKLRPPFPAIKGLWAKPTLINNVETFSLISWIFRNGENRFSEIGSEKSQGTKVFALAGKINRGGLIEVPMGTTIIQIVEEIGGGIQGGKKFKAVQIGGPSGGCIPASMADIPIDYESLIQAGAMMGSGGLVVLDEDDCMVDIARYFLSFTQDQSCGKCTFCRVGTKRLLDILEKICTGKGTEADLKTMEDLSFKVKSGSLCGLGRSAPNPVLSTLRYFREEYISHIKGVCPTGKCKEIIHYEINENCIGCTKCYQRCPSDAIISEPHNLHVIDNEKCIKCDICRKICPIGAVVIK